MCNLAFSSILQMHQNHFMYQNRSDAEDDVFYEDTREHAALILENNSIEIVFENEDDLQYYSSVGGVKVIGYVILDDENYPKDEILDAFNHGFKTFADYWKSELTMTGRHLLGYDYTKGYVYDKAPISVHDIIYAEASDDYGCVVITLHLKDETKSVYTYGLGSLEDNEDYKNLRHLGVEVR